ncbi:hypothetical protein LR48_Vigan325s004000 [Vigna angularis]|uniref:Inactive cytochrome P450 n=1 Tax=Phaseolus angularis TaxID=3914 RepID=A0A0L9T8F9_PHAAN|nr:Inactive cytochrome P450 [Vigna angularis]KOM26868.1 hypothetical protein LR48_Vigan325s004000 [Vigna angularis]
MFEWKRCSNWKSSIRNNAEPGIEHGVFGGLVDPEFESAGEFKELVWRIIEDAGRVNLSDYFPLLKPFDLQGVKGYVAVSYVRLYDILDRMIWKRVTKGDFLDVLAGRKRAAMVAENL